MINLLLKLHFLAHFMTMIIIYYIHWYYKDSSSNYNITITRDQLKTMLMNLLYHYPNTKLNNGINRS